MSLPEDAAAVLDAVDRTALTPVVRRALRRRAALPVDWRWAPIEYKTVLSGRALAQFEGTADFGADAREEHHQLEPEEDDGVDGRTTVFGVAVGDQFPDEPQVHRGVEVPVEVVLRDESFEPDRHRAVEGAQLRGPNIGDSAAPARP